MAAIPSALLSTIIPIAIVSPILVIRMSRMRKGTAVSTERAIAFSAILAAISIFLVANSFSLGISSYFIFVYVTIAGTAGYAAYHYSNRLLYFWKTPDGYLYVKGGTSIFLLYIVSVVARLALSSTFGGAQGFFGNSQGEVSQTALTAATLFDGLLVAGAALMIGRNARIISRYKRIAEGKESLKS